MLSSCRRHSLASYRRRDLCDRERQLLPIAAWLRRFDRAAVAAVNAASSRGRPPPSIDASALVGSLSRPREPTALLGHLVAHVPALVHFLPRHVSRAATTPHSSSDAIPAMFDVSLLDRVPPHSTGSGSDDDAIAAAQLAVAAITAKYTSTGSNDPHPPQSVTNCCDCGGAATMMTATTRANQRIGAAVATAEQRRVQLLVQCLGRRGANNQTPHDAIAPEQQHQISAAATGIAGDHLWYARKVSRPLLHVAHNLLQEVSIVEHARWVCGQVAVAEQHDERDHVSLASPRGVQLVVRNDDGVCSTTATLHVCPADAAAMRVRQQQRPPVWAPKCIVDVGGGNGIMAFLAEQRMMCDTAVVIDAVHPPKSVDSSEADGGGTAFAVGSHPYFRRVIKTIAEVDWRRDVGFAADDVLVISKHLCGGAIDDLLRSFADQAYYPRALCLSSCCHFRRMNHARYINSAHLRDLMLDDGETWAPGAASAGAAARPWIRTIDLHGDGDQNKDQVGASARVRRADIESFLLPLTDIAVTHTETPERYVEKRRLQGYGKARWRIGGMLKACLLASNAPTADGKANAAATTDHAQFEREWQFGPPNQHEGGRSLFASVCARTNWIGTAREPWMAATGGELECALDAGRVAFLRCALPVPYVATMAPFIVREVTPRNRIMLAFRRRNVGYFLAS